MRAQYCREHIDDVAEQCGLGSSAVAEVKQAAQFCEDNSDFSECATKAIIALIRIKDETVKDLAISLAKKALNTTTPTGGKKCDRLTEPEIRKLIEKAKMQINGGSVKKEMQERNKPVGATPQSAEPQTEKQVTTPQPPSAVTSVQGSSTSQQTSGLESDHERRIRLNGMLHHKQESSWKPRHIPREEFIYELTDRYMTERQRAVVTNLIEKGEVDDVIDAILWIIDRFRELQDPAS